jgi:hypothetical protein
MLACRAGALLPPFLLIVFFKAAGDKPPPYGVFWQPKQAAEKATVYLQKVLEISSKMEYHNTITL